MSSTNTNGGVRRIFSSSREVFLQFDADRDVAPALKKKGRGGGGGAFLDSDTCYFILKRSWVSFPDRHGVGISSYMTDLSDKQASKKKKKKKKKVHVYIQLYFHVI